MVVAFVLPMAQLVVFDPETAGEEPDLAAVKALTAGNYPVVVPVGFVEIDCFPFLPLIKLNNNITNCFRL